MEFWYLILCDVYQIACWDSLFWHCSYVKWIINTSALLSVSGGATRGRENLPPSPGTSFCYKAQTYISVDSSFDISVLFLPFSKKKKS